MMRSHAFIIKTIDKGGVKIMIALLNFLEKNLGDMLVATAGMISLVILIYFVPDIFRSNELKIRFAVKRFLKIMNGFVYLENAPDMIKDESFLYGHKNKGKSPCDVESIQIDESYTSNHSAYLIKGDDENE